MRTLFIAAASALFFAAVVTELSMRVWPGQYFALLLLAFLALFLSGVLNLRLAGWLGSTTADTARRDRAGGRQRPRQGGTRGNRQGRGRAGRPAGADNRSNAGQESSDRRDEPAPGGPRESGTVKWFNRSKGFGFVIRESGEEIFVHQRSIRSTGEGENRRRPALRDGQAITFVVAKREKGLQAEDVVPAE